MREEWSLRRNSNVVFDNYMKGPVKQFSGLKVLPTRANDLSSVSSNLGWKKRTNSHKLFSARLTCVVKHTHPSIYTLSVSPSTSQLLINKCKKTFFKYHVGSLFGIGAEKDKGIQQKGCGEDI